MNDAEKKELIMQVAELRALMVVQSFMLMSFLENQGCDPESLLNSVEKMTNRSADGFENRMRKVFGIEPRSEPRESILEKQRAHDEALGSIDWSKMKEN